MSTYTYFNRFKRQFFLGKIFSHLCRRKNCLLRRYSFEYIKFKYKRKQMKIGSENGSAYTYLNVSNDSSFSGKYFHICRRNLVTTLFFRIHQIYDKK